MRVRACKVLGLAVMACAMAAVSSPLWAQSKGGALGRFISPDFCAALVIHPERIAESPLAATIKAALPKDTKANDPSAVIGMLGGQQALPPGLDLAKLAKALEGKAVHRVVILIDPFPTPAIPASAGVILQFTTDVDSATILAALGTDWQPGEANGTKFQTMKNPTEGQPPIALCAVDGQTILAGLEPTVAKMLAKDQGSQPLLDQLKRTSLNNDIVIEFLIDPLLAKLSKATGKPAEESLAALGDPSMAAMAKEVKALSASINLSGETLFHAELVTSKDETAAGLAMMSTMGIASGKQKMEEFKKQPAMLVPPPLVPLVSKLGDEVLGSLTVTPEGPKLVINLPMPKSLPEFITAAGQIMAAMTPPK